MPEPILLTIGHGTVSASRFVDQCFHGGIKAIVDVRTAPGSRKHPQFARAAMEEWLPEAGLRYRWERRLGGFRKPWEDSPNTGLHNEAFRGYADYMESDEWLRAFKELMRDVRRGGVAVMCAETLWWRCHRRLIADYAVLIERIEVRHVMKTGTVPHGITRGARVVKPYVFYPAPVAEE
jgi:uncharacterized protein (DUF488 family)